jgi:arabinan endo-1,5-alpha-L-arabinosidase
MSWSLIENGAAFPTKPDWAEGNITSVTGIFAKSLATYFLFYKLGDSDIGAAHARTPQGPYIDYGKVTDQATLGVSGIEDAFVYAFGSTYCLFFTVPGEGIYGIRLNIVKPEPVPILPVTSGSIFKITDDRFSGVFIRKKGSTYWLYATQGGNIVMGKSASIEGPYVNKDGAALIGNDGANLVIPTDEYSELGQVAGVQSDAAGNDWIIYTAVESKHPELTTGASRYVLMLNQIKTDQDGWPAEQIQAKSGYVTPRFEN